MLEVFDQIFLNQKFAHAYGFIGPEGVGKKTFAIEVASRHFKQPIIGLSSHPDFHLIDCQALDAESFREKLSLSTTKPFIEKNVIVIFDNFDQLSQTAQQSLLKRLEEPSASTLFFLVSEANLLPTIESRCVVFNFNRLSKLQIQEVVPEAKPSHLKFSQGSINKTISLVNDPEKLALLEKALHSIKVASNETDLWRVYFELSKSEDSQFILSSLVYAIKTDALNEPKYLPLLEKAFESLKVGTTNINPKFIYQNLII